MKRTLSCPIMLSNFSAENREDYLNMAREVEASRIFIAVGREAVYYEDPQQVFPPLAEAIRYFRANGMEVGVWINSYGFGVPLTPEGKKLTQGMARIRSALGEEREDALCPEDPRYTALFCDQMRRIAETEPDLIMLDDDLCLSVRPGLGCFCDFHMKKLEEKTGRALNPNTLMQDFFVGGRNPLRDAFCEVMAETNRAFCAAVRRAVDEVNSRIRVGFCAGYTSWDIEGATAAELTHLLAGNTKPFLRYTGAPYWVSKMVNRFPGQRLHSVIEFTRAQAHWCRNEGIECFNEADSYPRARYQVPANLLECFDAATVASSGMDSLKYLFDYYSSTGYETGYAKLHKKNRPLYAFLEEGFASKKAAGVQVFERMRKFADMEFPEGWNQKRIMTTSHPMAAAVLTALTVPVTYEENPACGVAFNVNVDAVETMPKRMILDLVAAERLQARGIDVGLEKAELLPGEPNPPFERFGEERVSIYGSQGRYFRCALKSGAVVESVFEMEEEIPASYRYFNGETDFLVYTFDAYSVPQGGTVFCSYARQQQLLDFYSDFPVVRKAPFLYSLCKRSEGETAVFFANLFEDELFDFEIELDRDYADVTCFGAEVSLEGRRLKVRSEVAPYGMFALCLKE